jgi:hypothetical protein
VPVALLQNPTFLCDHQSFFFLETFYTISEFVYPPGIFIITYLIAHACCSSLFRIVHWVYALVISKNVRSPLGNIMSSHIEYGVSLEAHYSILDHHKACSSTALYSSIPWPGLASGFFLLQCQLLCDRFPGKPLLFSMYTRHGPASRLWYLSWWVRIDRFNIKKFNLGRSASRYADTNRKHPCGHGFESNRCK